MESSSSSSSLSMVGTRNRCDVATTLYHYGTSPPQKEEYRNHHHPDPHHDSNDDDDDDGCGSEHPSHAYDENDNYYVNHYNVIDRIDSTRISILPPPPPPPLLFQPQCGGTTCNGTNRRYHHSHTQRKKKKCSSSLYYFSPSLSLSPLVVTKSMATTYTPTTTASTATWTSTHERNVSQTKRSPSLSPPPRRLEPLLEHWNHHHPYDDDSSRHDSEPALQFVERTTCEMHEIVQYWLSRDLQQQLYGYDPADSLDVECTTNTSTTATTSILQQQQQPLESLPSPNNTLWNLSTDDMSYQQTNSCSDAHEEEDFARQSYCHTNESLSLLSFEPSLVNGSSTVVQDTNVTLDADCDFDGCVEELFTELDHCCRRRMPPQRSHCHRRHHHHYCDHHQDPTVTPTTSPTKNDDNTMDDDQLHYHHDSTIIDADDTDKSQQELHHLATLLYSSDAVVIRDNYSRPSDAVLDIVHEASTTLLSRRRPRQIPFPLNCFMQRRQYHPYMMVHPKQKATSVLSTVAPTSLWQWIDEQMNQGDLQRQQFQRRVSNVVFILVSLLMSLLFILLLLQSIQFLYSHGWYLPFAPNNQATEHAWAGNMIHTSTLSCHVT